MGKNLPNSSENKEPKNILDRLKNTKVIVFFVVIGLVLAWYAAFTGNILSAKDNTEKLLNIFHPPTTTPTAVAFSSQGTTFCAYRGHKGSVNSVAWSPNGQLIVSGGSDGTVQIWNALTCKNAFTYRGHEGNVIVVAWSPDGQRIASGGADGTVQVWIANSGASVYSYKCGPPDCMNNSSVTALAWSPNGQYIAYGREDGIVQVFDASLGNEDSTPFTFYPPLKASSVSPPIGVGTIGWSPNSKLIAFPVSVSFDPLGYTITKVQIWKVDDIPRKLILTYQAMGIDVRSLTWSPNGKFIATAEDSGEGNYGYVNIWDAQQGNRLPSIAVPVYLSHPNIKAVAWSCNSKLLALGSSLFGEVEIWNITTNKYYLYSGHSKSINAIAWSPNNMHISTASADGTVQVWQADEEGTCTS